MGLFGSNAGEWEVIKNIELKDLTTLIKVFNNAMETSKFRYDKSFMHSIKLNILLDELWVATFDYSKSGIRYAVYQNQIEELIYEANLLLNKKKKYINYKFDITGSYTIGKVVIMRKNKEIKGV